MLPCKIPLLPYECATKPGELFSTVLFTKGLSKGQGVRIGYYRNDDKAIRIYDRYLSQGRAFTDEIILHELAHGLDYTTEGSTEKSNCHDERFVIAARALGANVSRYLKDNKEKNGGGSIREKEVAKLYSS